MGAQPLGVGFGSDLKRQRLDPGGVGGLVIPQFAPGLLGGEDQPLIVAQVFHRGGWGGRPGGAAR